MGEPTRGIEYLPGYKIGCHINTATNDLIRKLALGGKDLAEYSLETVQMFYDDAKSAGYTL